ncbi:hypothetical protein [Actinocrispum sp. NPDC049592]|uniref:hypothetical protein n=1 Tax=Actinocrispum sp. NPDC049592 TaxID=3154835 RepID=UPI003428809D
MDEEESGATLRDSVMKGGSDGPEDVDAAFAQIVAELEREGVGANVPTDLSDLAELTDAPAAEQAEQQESSAAAEEPPPAASPPPVAWRGSDTEVDWAWSTDDDHYVPPEPPPIPRPSALTILALVLMLIALFLLVAPSLIGLATRVATPIALISAAVGIGLVVLRIRQNNSDDSDDNGAQV